MVQSSIDTHLLGLSFGHSPATPPTPTQLTPHNKPHPPEQQQHLMRPSPLVYVGLWSIPGLILPANPFINTSSYSPHLTPHLTSLRRWLLRSSASTPARRRCLWRSLSAMGRGLSYQGHKYLALVIHLRSSPICGLSRRTGTESSVPAWPTVWTRWSTWTRYSDTVGCSSSLAWPSVYSHWHASIVLAWSAVSAAVVCLHRPAPPHDTRSVPCKRTIKRREGEPVSE